VELVTRKLAASAKAGPGFAASEDVAVADVLAILKERIEEEALLGASK
jgi:hypothetical protein